MLPLHSEQYAHDYLWKGENIGFLSVKSKQNMIFKQYKQIKVPSGTVVVTHSD